MLLAAGHCIHSVIVKPAGDKRGIFTGLKQLADVEVIACGHIVHKAGRVGRVVVHDNLDLKAVFLLLILCSCHKDFRMRLTGTAVILRKGHVPIRDDVVVLLVFLALCAVVVIQTGKVSAEACIIVIGHFVVDILFGDIVVEIFQVRAADERAVENMLFRIRIIHGLRCGAVCSTVVRMVCIVIFIADFI